MKTITPDVRFATEADLPAIVEIYNQTIPGRMVTADTSPVTIESRTVWFNAHTPDARPLWVAELDGKVVAWLSFNSFYGRPAYNATVEVSLYVAETARRRGIGAWFVQYAIDWASKNKITTLLGFIWSHNDPSLRLFEHFGFQRWGYLPRVAVLDGVDRDLVIVGRRVS